MNLLLILGLHLLSQRAFLLENHGFQKGHSLEELQQGFTWLMWASLLLAAAGYLINDYYDQITDRVNQPKKTANVLLNNKAVFWISWLLLNLLAIYLGFQIDALAADTQYGLLFIAISGVLWAYNRSKWSKFIIGPAVISGLVALNLLLVQNFASNIHAIDSTITLSGNQLDLIFATKIQWFWRIAFLGFLTNFIRELVKDIEDINGDQNAGRHTLPVVLGIERTAKVAVFFGFILVLSLGAFAAMAMKTIIALSAHFTLALALAVWVTYKCSSIERPTQAKSVSLMLKLLLALGLLSLFWL